MSDTQSDPQAAELALMQRRLERERAARKAAEVLLSSKSDELYLALQQASESQRQLELALWASGEAIWEWDAAKDTFLLRSFSRARGEPAFSDETFFDLLRLVHPDDVESTSLIWGMHLAGNHETLDLLLRFRRGDSWRWIRVRGQAVTRRADGWAERVVGTVKDVSRYRAAEDALRLMASAFASSRDAMVVMTEQWQIIEANQTFLDLIGLRQQNVGGDSFCRFIDLPEAMLRRLRDQGFGRAEIMLNRVHERGLPLEISINRFAAQAGNAPYLIATLRDISERRQAASTLERLAREDAVTRLPNRHALQEVLAVRLASLVPGKLISLLFIDLDGFKSVNDSLGHEAGDSLLQIVAGQLQAELSSQDMLARWGGDEFVAVLHESETTQRSDKLAQRLLHVLRQPIAIGGHLTGISGSIGIAVAPDDGDDAGTLLRRADVAMYAAKRAGRDQARHYHPDLDSGGLQRMRLIALLRQAVERNALSFVAQPKVRADGGLSGCELLIRWHTEEYGAVSPVQFIPLAEETGLIVQIGHQAIREAAALVREFDAAGADQLSVAVNLSPLQLQDPALEQVLLDSCRKQGIAPQRLQLEITESAFLDNKLVIETLLLRLKQHGFTLALDDFGTGYSSLSYLRDLPFDVVKIDRAFLRDIERDSRSGKLLAGIVDLCHALGMALVAEGVETASQLAVLTALGLSEFQGFLFHRPMAQQDLLGLLRHAGGEAA
ncbi:putative bifunctional diguanylate cyclase/phosphodiesterase [Chitinimonas taiwanensis]|uniref:PAS domain S-box-containing protein/diguanylate cyclase (GGDEF) domain-containing protein n=1 Tax=Chitinimonas taiwanensis DSM 18899 TaxID=1121279 RepID=A0A1K2HNJ4_9NEIS|nr:bifunctional diguanylate cyclase/phosphodiesterase [Chitinimonas taiwanensis]SFZ77810.1 PAS domain S-box-containing protein/diguanylate cyclase (GGDEF) domain-containing protein [Chitinimonas taiwanensis DSM 18899]